MVPTEEIRESTIREMIQGGATWTACLKGESGGFSVIFRFMKSSRILTSSRGQTRRFASLNTAAEFLKQLGIYTFEVDASLYIAGRIRKARPDRAEALRKTRTAPRQQELLSEHLE